MKLGFSQLLPALIIVICLSFSVRLVDVFIGLKSISSQASAETISGNASVLPHALSKIQTAAGDSEEDAAKNDKSAGVETVDEEVQEPKWRDANDSALDLSDVKFEMFGDLSERRKKLDERERGIQTREALLKAAENELDKKLQELTRLKTEIEGLLDQQTEEEEKRIQSLVKIYEGMKPKDAARIFDTLDINVLVSVITKMSERKIAPVLAAMNPERARTVTIMMAEQNQLPILQ